MKANFAHDLNYPVFHIMKDLAAEMHIEAYLIGGFVRDFLLGRSCKDIDVVVTGNGIAFAQKLASKLEGKVHFTVFKNFGTARINHNEYEYEIVGARKESYRANSRKPIVENGTLEDDQKRRDFTINALSLSLNASSFGDLFDPFNGIQDLKNSLIRTPLDPDITFSDDPLRMMRAIQFATRLNFTIDETTFASIKRNANRLEIVSKERISDELNKIMSANQPSKGFYLLKESGLLKKILPEFEKLAGVDVIEQKGHKDNFVHSLEVLDKIAAQSEDIWLRYAALLHDIAKPVTKKFIPGTGWTFHGHEFIGAKMVPGIFKRLKLPLNEKMKFVQKLVQLHLRPIALVEESVTDSAVRRLLFDAGDDIDSLMLLCNADITSKNPNKVRKHLANFELVKQKLVEIEEKDRLRNWQPPISGEDIMKTFGIQPCKQVGIIKDAIREAILEGNIPNDREKAWELMLEEGKKLGLQPL